MTTPHVSNQFKRLLEKRLRELAYDSYKERPSQRQEVYRMIKSDSAWEEFFEIGSLPDIPKFEGQLEYLSVTPGYHKKITPDEFAAGLEFERKLLDDKKWGVFDNRTELLGQSLSRTKEKYAVNTFSNAFSNAFDFMKSEEGLSLCNDSHTTKVSGISTSTGFDNAGSTALSKTSVASTRLLMRGFKNDIGEVIDTEPDMLIVPDNLADTAMEIVKTPKSLDTAEGNINPQYGRFKVMVYRRLDDSDTNNWFMVDSRMMKSFLVWIDRIEADTNATMDFETFITKVSIYSRFAYGHLDWRWIYGHNVS